MYDLTIHIFRTHEKIHVLLDLGIVKVINKQFVEMGSKKGRS